MGPQEHLHDEAAQVFTLTAVRHRSSGPTRLDSPAATVSGRPTPAEFRALACPERHQNKRSQPDRVSELGWKAGATLRPGSEDRLPCAIKPPYSNGPP